VTLEPEQLSEMFGAVCNSSCALAFEAAANAHFDILFNDSAATSYRSEFRN